MLNYITYSLIFIKLWGINKLFMNIPYYLIERLVISNVIKLTYQGGKYIIKSVGNYVFPEPLTVTISDSSRDASII